MIARRTRRLFTLVVAGALAPVSGCARRPRPLEPPPAPALAPAIRAAVAAAPSPLRRLSNEEYDNTVRDLLGDTTRPAGGFPPDDAVGGFESNSVSPITQALVERYQAAAEALAEAARPRLDRLAPCPPTAERAACAARFIERFGRAAFRRPLDARERASLSALYAAAAERRGHERALTRVIEAVLQSPGFLYRAEPVRAPGEATRLLSGYELATRLSYFLWASTPDSALLDAAASGALETAVGAEAAARRLLADPRAVDGVRSFYRQWLGLRELETLSREGGAPSRFTPELRRAMVEETLRFGAHVTLSGGDVVRALLTSDESFVDSTLAHHYGMAPGASAGFERRRLPAGQRAGVLTHASVLTVHASAEDASPIWRGKFVRERLLCQRVPPPPPEAVIALPRFDPTETKQERFARHRLDPACASCHRTMDPIGFGFEHYDSIGGWRDREGGRDVDARGVLGGTGEGDAEFDGALALGRRLAASPRAQRCVATQWMRAALGRSERDEDAPSLDAVHAAFVAAGFDGRALLIAIARSDSFRHVGFVGAPP